MFFVASRGHHADIGGTTPGIFLCSMSNKQGFDDDLCLIAPRFIEKKKFQNHPENYFSLIMYG